MITPSRNEREVGQLVSANRRLVDHMVNRYQRRFHTGTMERDDLVSWGLLGLVNAARAWDPSRGTFATLACRAIERMIIRGVNREWRPERENATVSLDEFLSGLDTEEGEVRWVDRFAADEDVPGTVLGAEQAAALRAALAALKPDERRLIERRFYDGDPVQQIASDLGVSRVWVSVRIGRILTRLRRILSSTEFQGGSEVDQRARASEGPVLDEREKRVEPVVTSGPSTSGGLPAGGAVDDPVVGRSGGPYGVARDHPVPHPEAGFPAGLPHLPRSGGPAASARDAARAALAGF